MSLVSVVVILIVVGILLWLVNTYIPIDGKILKIINILVVVVIVLWILSLFFNLGSLNTIRVGR